jgi:Restriction endonuclease
VKKAEKPAASRAKSDKGSKSKAAAPQKAKAKKDGGKAAKVEAKPAKKAAKAEPKVETKVDARGGKGKKPEAKSEAKVEAKSDAKGKGRGKAAQPAAPVAPAEEFATAAAVVAELQAEVESDGEVTQPIQSLPEAAPAELSEEERELSSLYQGELEAPSIAHGEFKDQKTADEDRPMLPEINARDERRRGWEDRRERRRQEREQRRLARRDGHRGGQHQQSAGGGGGNGQPRPPHGGQQQAPQQGGFRNDRNEQRGDRPQGGFERDRGERNDRGDRGDRDRNQGGGQDRSLPPAGGSSASAPVPGASSAASIAAASASAAPVEAVGFGTPMAVATATLFSQLRNGQPLPVKQLAAMLRKRGLIEGEPDLIWQQLRAELVADERTFRAMGLRPRVVHRGRDLFAPGPAASAEESQLVGAVAAIAATTARSLSAWIAQASPAAFERLIHAYLVAVGYRDVNWVKRVDGIAYAQATAPGIERSVLVSARSGGAPIDRRGIGELRVGVEAKGLPFGYLFAASSLSTEAERELERAGRSIAVICGDALVSALMGAGIGVATTAVSVRLLDDQFLDDLNAG